VRRDRGREGRRLVKVHGCYESGNRMSLGSSECLHVAERAALLEVIQRPLRRNSAE